MEYSFYNDLNLEYRMDNLTGNKETFSYTNNKQLSSWEIERDGITQDTYMMGYDGFGNITTMPGIEYSLDYSNTDKPYTLQYINGNSDLISDTEQTITYTDFKKVSDITEGENTISLIYGIDNQRGKSVFSDGESDAVTKYYLGNYEEEIEGSTTKKVHYISGGNGLAAIYIEENGTGNLYHAYTDHLGSITALVNSSGSIVEKYSYNPWGNRRDPDQWEEEDVRSTWLTDRGYTMHEHLDVFGLINMNGRVYDPVIGRFLSPDPYIQTPGNWLNYNRYGYCLNNPLIYTDPSGEIIGSVITFLLEGSKAIVKSAENVGRELFLEGGLDITSRDAMRQAWADMDPTTNTQMGNAWAEFDPTTPGNKTNNALKIDAGLFMHIPGWETPQTLLGNVISHIRNLTGNVDNVDIHNWTVLVNNDEPGVRGWGFSFGPYINSKNLEVGDNTYMHEYGHTLQSRILGPLYIPKVAIPSGLSYWLGDEEYHNNSWYEVWASRLGNAPNHQTEYRHDNFWYWYWVVTLPIFPN